MLMDRNGRNRHLVFRGKAWSGDLHYATFHPTGNISSSNGTTSGFVSPPAEKAVLRRSISNGTHLRQLTPWTKLRRRPRLVARRPMDPLPHPRGTAARSRSTSSSTRRHAASPVHTLPRRHPVASRIVLADGASIVSRKGPEGGNIDVYTMRLTEPTSSGSRSHSSGNLLRPGGRSAESTFSGGLAGRRARPDTTGLERGSDHRASATDRRCRWRTATTTARAADGATLLPALKSVPLFAGLTPQQLRRVAEVSRLKRFAAGATVVHLGADGDTFYVILDGRALVVRENRSAA